MKILIFVILLIFTIFVPYSAFAQESLAVNPPFLQDGSDTCSKLFGKQHDYLFAHDEPISITIPEQVFSEDISADYNRTTVIDYNGTKLITTLNSDAVNGISDTIHSTMGGYGPLFVLSKINPILLKNNDNRIEITQGTQRDIIEAIVNIGNKTNPILYPVQGNMFSYVINYKDNGTSVGDYFEHPIFLDYHGYVGLDTPFPIFSFDNFSHDNPIVHGTVIPANLPIGNYTISAVVRFVGNVDSQCQMVYLWSQPIDLTVIQERKIPEFPFVIPIFSGSIISVIVFYRLKSS